jgi:hypothetical protein
VTPVVSYGNHFLSFVVHCWWYMVILMLCIWWLHILNMLY